jgi:phage repressor protein C with HTH and peptisase S24 domain
MMAIADNIKKYRLAAGLSQPKLAKLCGWESQSRISNYETEVRSPSIDDLRTIASALNINLIQLINGDNNTAHQDIAEYSDNNTPIDLENNIDYPSIKRVNLKLSAGISGFAIDYDVENKAPIVMRKEWFGSRGYRPDKLLAVLVHGDSMQNGLYDGDTVVINTADNMPSDGEVFAINYEGEMLIKRMVRDAGVWWLSSDNPDQRKYPRKECASDMCLIIGKIVHKQSERI